MRLLVIGGCGFVGSNFIRYVLSHYGPEMITNVDALTSGRLGNLEGVAETFGERYEFLRADFADAAPMEALLSLHPFFAIVHFAAKAEDGTGTAALLDRARRHGVQRLLLVSAARSAEEAALTAYRKHGQEIVITQATDTYGPFQPVGGFIPRTIASALRDEPMTASGAARDWLHVEDHCAELFATLLESAPGTAHFISANDRAREVDVAHRILDHLGKSRSLVTILVGDADTSAPLEDQAPERLSGNPRHRLNEALGETIDWYIRHPEWINKP